MTEKISFAIENAELIDERIDSKFSVLSLDFFASGKNRHDMYVSEQTLLDKANTIKNCPLVWKYDKVLDDAYTHDDEEVPCGFVPEKSEIKSRKLADGRTMLSVISYVWKKYSGSIMEFFKRDGEKPISVEMSVYDTKELNNGLLELLDYKFEAITILGSMVTPAIPDAKALVLSFSADEKSEYELDYELEFGKFDDLNFTIPSSVKSAAKSGLELRQKFGRGGTSVGLATARYLVNNKVATPEKVRHIAKYFPRHAGDNLDDKESNGWIAWQLWGGDSGRRWSTSLVKKMNEIEEKKLSYFSDGNEIDQKTDSMTLGENKEENKEKLNMEDEEKKVEEMATEPPVPEKEEKEQDMAAPPPEEKKEDEEQEKEESEDEDMSAFAKVPEMFALMGDDAKEMAVKFESEKKVDWALMCHAMFAKMAKMKEDNDAYMAENSDLKKFKADMEMAQYNAKVMATLGEVQESMPADKFAEVKDDSANFSLDSFDAWRNKTLAIAFAYTKDMKNDDGITRMSLPFTLPANKTDNGDVWEKLK